MYIYRKPNKRRAPCSVAIPGVKITKHGNSYRYLRNKVKILIDKYSSTKMKDKKILNSIDLCIYGWRSIRSNIERLQAPSKKRLVRSNDHLVPSGWTKLGNQPFVFAIVLRKELVSLDCVKFWQIFLPWTFNSVAPVQGQVSLWQGNWAERGGEDRPPSRTTGRVCALDRV